MKQFNMRFKIARLEAGLTQKELAETTGVSESKITKIETGRRAPDREFAQRLAELLGKPAGELFDE